MKHRCMLLLPAGLAMLILLGGPMGYLLSESVRTYVPGRLSSDPTFTFDNYTALTQRSYLLFLGDTLQISSIAAIVSTAIGALVAHYLVREAGPKMRVIVLTTVVAMMFIGIARVFSLSLAFGNYGVLGIFRDLFGIRGNEYWYLQSIVIAGIVHYTVPVATLTMVGYFASIDRRLMDAAQTLGASRLQSFRDVFVPLAVPGVLAVLLMSFALAASSFSVPVIIGRGLVPTITTLIYQRFSETPNYPSGAALSISLFVISVIVVSIGAVLARIVKSKSIGTRR